MKVHALLKTQQLNGFQPGSASIHHQDVIAPCKALSCSSFQSKLLPTTAGNDVLALRGSRTAVEQRQEHQFPTKKPVKALPSRPALANGPAQKGQRMRTQMAALAFANGALALGIGLAGPAVADADYWAAVAASPSTGESEFANGPNGKQATESAALSGCAAEQGNPTDCAVVASSPQCVALATNPGNYIAYAGGSGATRDAASSAAIAALAAKGYPGGHVPSGNTACGTDT
jgi:hypothetical protein